MNRKNLLLALVFVLAITLSPMEAYAADEPVNVNITGHTVGNLGTEIDDYMSDNGISSYDSITGLTVTGGSISFGDTIDTDLYALRHRGMGTTLKTADFSGTAFVVNKLPSYGFGNFTGLTEIKLPDSVTYIEDWAFSNCPSLDTVYLPSGLTDIEYNVFNDSSKLKDIFTDSAIPPGYITDDTFVGVAADAVLHVPDGSGSAWDNKDITPNNGKIYGLQIENMAPIIAHTETRTSDPTAEIDVYSNEPGYCYYAFVKDGVAAPAIDTSGAGIAFNASNQLTISLTGLDSGAYDVYIKAKDQLNNVTELIKLDLDVYVPMLDVVINNHTTGNLQTEIDGYFSSLGYPAKYEKIRSLTVSAGALNTADFDFFYNTYQMGYVTQSIDLSGTSSLSIPDNTFEYYNMTNISLPSGIESIGAEAFSNCGNLADITISITSPPAVGTDTFSGVAPNAKIHVPAGSSAAYKAVNDGNTADNLWYGLTVVDPASSNHSSGSGGGGSTTVSTYKAEIKDGAAGTVTLPITVNAASNTGTVSLEAAKAEELFDKTGVVINMPVIPGVNAYALQLPAATLAAAQGSGTLSTGLGSLTIPGQMLSTLSGTDGKQAVIIVGQGDKTALKSEEKAAVGDRPLVQITLMLDGVRTAWSNPNAPVTVAIPYTPTAEELANPESIIIWYLDGSGKPVCIPNGQYDTASGMVIFTTTHFSYYAVGYDPVHFSDVAEGAWYNKAVSFLSARGITTGTGGGNFSPYAKLTRGEFLVMLMRAYGIEPDKNPQDNFSDAGSTYYTGYLAAAKRLDISNGIGGNLYEPEKAITRQEMFTLLHNALKVIDQLPEGTATGKSLSAFSDSDKISSWAKEAMTLLAETGTISGNGGKLSPAGTATRAEMAQVLYNLLLK